MIFLTFDTAHQGQSVLAGKSECTRCGSATGRFCRACLLIRYGMELGQVRQEMEAGTWLCPHCYEDDHPYEVISRITRAGCTLILVTSSICSGVLLLIHSALMS